MCPNGHEVSPGNTFCPICGAAVQPAVSPTPLTPMQTTPIQPVRPATESEFSSGAEKRAVTNPWEDDRVWVATSAGPQEALTREDLVEGFVEQSGASGSRRWFLLGGAAGLVVVALAIVLVFINVINRGVEVPNAVGQQYSTAQEVFENAEFVTVSREQVYSDSVPEGIVIEQTPKSGEVVSSETPIVLVVSLGPEVTDVTVTFDMTTVRSYMTSTLSCSTWTSLFRGTYGDAVLVDESRDEVGRMRTTGWIASSSNGTYFPCETTTVFEDVPVNRSSYQVVLNPDESGQDRSPSYSRAQMERNGWRILW